jgi:hypothetical protein
VQIVSSKDALPKVNGTDAVGEKVKSGAVRQNGKRQPMPVCRCMITDET